MFNWFKGKNKTDLPVVAKKSREEIIAQANENARIARANIGQENLDRIAAMMHQKNATDSVSPAEQARKILEHMDKAHIADFLKTLYTDKPPTKH